MTIKTNLCIYMVLLACYFGTLNGWMFESSSRRKIGDTTTRLGSIERECNSNGLEPVEERPSSRRHFIFSTLTAIAAPSLLVLNPDPSAAVTRAIGGAEAECRAKGNCLEVGDLDGAVGWAWGGKDRCDATDPLCGVDGKMRETVMTGKPLPTLTNKVSHTVDITFAIGRKDSATIRLGLFGEDAPSNVKQFLTFVTQGLVTTSQLAFENGMGVKSVPVSITRGGTLNGIVPGERLDIGIPSQAAAYARSRGVSKAGDDFLPQPRPKALDDDGLESSSNRRLHDAAGLLSVPAKGIGFGGRGLLSNDDECFESAFQITATAVPSMDKEGRRVIGQVLDQESMANLERLVSLPTQKGLKGVIPGQNSGPPLLKVVVNDVSVAKSS